MRFASECASECASDASAGASARALSDAALALALRGEGGGVTLPARCVAALPSGNASRTIAVWAQLNLASASSAGESCCLWSHGMFGSREVLAVVANVEQRVWEVHVSAFGEVLQTGASLDSAWHHHCLVHDGAVLVYYLDGYEVLRHGVTLATPSPAVFELGGFVPRSVTFGSTLRLRSRGACAAERARGGGGASYQPASHQPASHSPPPRARRAHPPPSPPSPAFRSDRALLVVGCDD